MQPDLILTPFARDASPSTMEPIPDARTPTDPPEKATWEQGFPLVTMTPLAAGGIPPKGQDFNGVLKAISEHTVFLGGGGQYKWSDAYVSRNGGYSSGDVVQANDGRNSYVSLVDNNTTNFNSSPGSIGVTWGLYSGVSVRPTQATETNSGIARVATQAETDLGVLDSAIVTPKKLRFGVSYSFGMNGFLALPSWLGGFIFQWGFAEVVAGPNGSLIPMPMAFPNTALGMWMTWLQNVQITSSSPSYMGAFQAGFGAFRAFVSETSGSFGTMWLAIGR